MKKEDFSECDIGVDADIVVVDGETDRDEDDDWDDTAVDVDVIADAVDVIADAVVDDVWTSFRRFRLPICSSAVESSKNCTKYIEIYWNLLKFI